MNEFYDVVDSEGNVVETAEEQRIEANENVPVEIPLERPKPQLSPGEIKKLRKQYVTRRLPKVNICGHRLDLGSQPRHRNCQYCWFAWFQNHGEIVQQLDEMFVADGGKLIIQLQGTKFFQRWRMFMATVAQWKKQMEEANAETNKE